MCGANFHEELGRNLGVKTNPHHICPSFIDESFRPP